MALLAGLTFVVHVVFFSMGPPITDVTNSDSAGTSSGHPGNGNKPYNDGWTKTNQDDDAQNQNIFVNSRCGQQTRRVNANCG